MNGYLSDIVQRGAKPFGQLPKGIKIPWSAGGIIQQFDAVPLSARNKVNTEKEATEHNKKQTVTKESHTENVPFKKRHLSEQDHASFTLLEKDKSAFVSSDDQDSIHTLKEHTDRESLSKTGLLRETEESSIHTFKEHTDRESLPETGLLRETEESSIHTFKEHTGRESLPETGLLRETEKSSKDNSFLHKDQTDSIPQTLQRGLPRYPTLQTHDLSPSGQSASKKPLNLKEPENSHNEILSSQFINKTAHVQPYEAEKHHEQTLPLSQQLPKPQKHQIEVDELSTSENFTAAEQTLLNDNRACDINDEPDSEKRLKSLKPYLAETSESKERFNRLSAERQKSQIKDHKGAIKKDTSSLTENKPKLTIKRLDIQVINQEPAETAQKTGVTGSQFSASDSWQELDRFYPGRFYLNL